MKLSKEIYYENYDDITRFMSYFYQIDLVKKLKPKTVLEIGVGNKTVSNYLKQYGFIVKTCDLNKELRPDYVADIKRLPFKNNSYDAVLAFEILEHLPWEEVDKALKELHRVTKKYVIISIPYSCLYFELLLKFPLIRRILKRQFINMFFRIPYFFADIKFKGEHHWEMGRKNYPIERIRNLFRTKFKIIKEIRPVLNPYHYFFVLKKYTKS
ncbi:MAG: methyltransferase domain-containing protein [Candidatus Aenigmarchaeota archaeon]|nr:methyltransferase domain-containing protein [Candidatus Aenigmarchaeota archaeon]